MHRATTRVVVLCLAILAQAPAEVGAEELNLKRTTELLQKPLGEITFPKAKLEQRIVALRALATSLGIRLTSSEGVEAVAKRWTYPAVSLQEGDLRKALVYTVDATKLVFIIRPGEVHLLLTSELPRKTP